MNETLSFSQNRDEDYEDLMTDNGCLNGYCSMSDIDLELMRLAELEYQADQSAPHDYQEF